MFERCAVGDVVRDADAGAGAGEPPADRCRPWLDDLGEGCEVALATVDDRGLAELLLL